MRKFYRWAALALLAATSVCIAASSTINISWTVPTARQSGVPLAVSEIKGYELTYTVDDNASVTVPIVGGATVSNVMTLMLAPRAAAYKTVWTIVAVDTNGLKSPPSAAVTAVISVPIGGPNAPGAFTVKVSCSGGQCSATIQ